MKFKASFFYLFCIVILSCESDRTDVVLPGLSEQVTIKKDYFSVTSSVKTLRRVQTSNLPIYQLGKIKNPITGEIESQIYTQIDPPPSFFGSYTQEVEDDSDTDSNVSTINEEEIITKVILRIPFFSDYNRDEDNNVVTDGERNVYQLDSIYGNRASDFNIKVQELTYYLRNLDPDENFEEGQIYYSDDDFSTNVGATLFDQKYSIDSLEIIRYKEDDTDTEDDESTEIDERESPRIQLELDKDFFQTKIMDKEGDEDLGNNKFNLYFRGLYISAHSFSDDIWMLLDFNNADIRVEYTYKSVDTNDDNNIVTKNSSASIGLGPITFNSFKYSGTTVSTSTNSNNKNPIFLAGGRGSYSELELFTQEELDSLKSKTPLINEANLTFKIDRIGLDALEYIEEPKRLYLFNMNDNSFGLIDYALDLTVGSTNSDDSYLVLGGNLQKSSDNKGEYYKIRITNHINNIISKDSTNVKIGVAVVNDIRSVFTIKAEDSEGNKIRVPVQTVLNPFGTILYGGEGTLSETDRLRLEMYTTEN